MLILAFSIFILIFINNLRAFGLNDLADEFYGLKPGSETEYFDNGWEKFASDISDADTVANIIAVIVTIAVSILIINLVNFFTRLFGGGTRKGKTIGALIRSLTKYIVVLVDVGVILSVCGIDVQTVLAGVGILTLIIGLGCQSLIQDVVAGLFIVFDDFFAVGDVVIIDGFRGTITDVGLKSTKLLDAGGNIKSINNSAITTVVNLSRMDSLVTVSISAGYNEDPVRVEGIIVKALPEIQKKIPAITDTLTYKGISAVNACDISYMVLCHCKEADRFQVTRDLNRELLVLFMKNDIELVFPQVTVNQPDNPVRPKTTAAQKADSEKAIAAMRALPEKKKKEKFSFFKRAKDIAADEVKGATKDFEEDE